MRPLLPICLTIVPTLLLLGSCRNTPGTSPSSSPSIHPSKSPIESGRRFSFSPYRSKPAAPANVNSLKGERYATTAETGFKRTNEAPRSTFSVDVDTASYTNVRRMITSKSKPPADAVRLEEMINYFDYNYPAATDHTPFSLANEVTTCPWKPKHKLVRIALNSESVKANQRGDANLVFLIDVSGSMSSDDKLPLLKSGFLAMIENLNPGDRVAIVTYAGSAGLVLPSTSCRDKTTITNALNNLSAGGSTAGGKGIELAYRVAKQNYVRNGINRVILATDGDFNVGLDSDGELVELITEKAKSGVFLSVLGFGSGNLNDSMLEKISGKGNGTYAYIDTLTEAKKVLVADLTQSITTVAKDVKLQVEFNPAHVKAYRLLGYDNRRLEDRDFNDDKKDAGEIGSGHQVTAFYEVVPVGVAIEDGNLLPLRYRAVESNEAEAGRFTGELMTVHLRYKQPTSSKSELLTYRIPNSSTPFTGSTGDFRFATSVAAFGLWLQRSEYAPRLNKTQILSWAKAGKGNDDFGYRQEFIDLVGAAKRS